MKSKSASIIISLLMVTNIFGAIAQNVGEPSSNPILGLPLPNIKVANSVTDEEGAIMWYGWESRLVCIQLNRDGLSADFTESSLIQENGDPMPTTAFISLTMLEDGSLLWATQEGSTKPFVSKFFLIEDPQCDGNTSYAKFLGIMPDDIGIEALYTDALNRVYVMDTGQQHSSSVGNRLLRFTGDMVMGDFTYEVVNGLSHSVPDIDGLGPGINKTNGWVVDTPGFAIDSYNLYNVDYETGAFSFIGTTDGPYATHAINGSYFSDGKSRLYTITGIPQVGETSSTLYEINPDTGVTLRNLGSGPSGTGLTGSLAPGPGDFPDENKPPVADAGPNQTVNEGNNVELNGSGSTAGQYFAQNVVALWHMNEGSGNVIYDETNNHHDGTIHGANWTTNGRFGNALSFDGVDDYIEIKPSDQIFGDNPDEWSYFVWFRTNNDKEEMAIISDCNGIIEPWGLRSDRTYAIDLTMEFSTWWDNMVLWSNLKNQDHGSGTGSPYNYTDDNWHFVAVTVSKIQDEKWTYIDGGFDLLGPWGIPELPGDYFDGDMLRIGTRWPLNYTELPDSIFTSYEGYIDEIVLFNRALSSHEILDYYNSGKEFLLGYDGKSAEIVSYEWDFESDGIYDYQETLSNVPDGAFDGITNHVYGDDGIFKATLRVTNNQNLTDTDTCNITVLNVDPTVIIKSAIMDVEIGLRVAGRKYNNVSMTLYEDGNPIGYVSIERMPGSPNDQMAWIPVTLDMTKIYNATVTFTPEDPPNIGANPVWIYIKFKNGSMEKIHHTFNVQQSKKRDSDHWNHVEPWEVDLNAHLIGHSFEITSHITDPGSDDETLTYTYGSQVVTITYLNDPPNPDPYPSPEIKPIDIIVTTSLTYEGPGTITLVVEDDDNIRLGIRQGTDSFDVV